MEHLLGIYLHFEDAFASTPRTRSSRGAATTPGRSTSARRGWSSWGSRSALRPTAPCARTRAGRCQRDTAPTRFRHVAVLALTTIGFPNMIAGLEWIEEVLTKEASPSGG
jgi:hypothetical protein